jgi:predicted nucleotidyltransferase
LALFGSAMRDDFRDDSDIDMLVEFEPDAPIGLFERIGLTNELTALFGRNVDLGERSALKPFVRDNVLASSDVIYTAAMVQEERH